MSVRQAVLVLVSVVGLVGCATPLPDSMYSNYGTTYANLTNCVQQGYISPASAAIGYDILNGHIANHTYDATRLQNEVSSRSARKQSESFCKTFEAQMLTRDRQLSRQRQDRQETNEALRSATESIRSATPKQTYCNKIGNQVFCNTY